VRCAPPDNRPLPVERDTCAPWLDREVTLLTPRLRAVLALGRFGWEATLACTRRLGWPAPAGRPAFGHGAELELITPDAGKVALIGSYHVSQQNTSTGRLTVGMLDQVLAQVRGHAPGGSRAGPSGDRSRV